jgi:hypothetical protein
MKSIILAAFAMIVPASLLQAQDIRTITTPVEKHLYATKGRQFDFSPKAIEDFNNREARYLEIKKKYEAGEATQEQLETMEYEAFCRENIYDIFGAECNFYCGCNYDTVIASSALEPQGNRSYEAWNAADLSYETAWVEGRIGYGIGEWIEYQFPANNPRITTMIFCNGYVRTQKAWEENGRVKKMMVTINGKEFTTLHFDDVYAEQYFDVGKIGWDHNKGANPSTEPIKIRFTILDVYPGTKYEDTAITEIYFDGIDVH